jgi:hypothetical protein
MGIAGRQMAEKRFDARCNYNAILNLLREITQEKHSTIR